MLRNPTLSLAAAAMALCAAVHAESPAQDQDAPATLPKILDLDTAFRIALQDSPSLRAAEARVRQAKAMVTQARSAFFPQVTAGATAANTWLSENDYSRARDAAMSQSMAAFDAQLQGSLTNAVLNGAALDFGGLGQSFATSYFQGSMARRTIDDSVENYGANLTATWILFNGFEREFSHIMAKTAHKESEAAYAEAQRLLLSAVAGSYYGAQLSRENIRIAEADIAYNKDLLRVARARRKAQTGSLSDELAFKVRMNAAKSSLLATQLDYRLALIGLAELLGVPSGSVPEDQELAPLPTETPEDMLLPEIDALLSYARGHRPDLRASELGVKRAKANVGVARSAYFPTVALSASKDGLRTDNYKFGEDDFGSTIGLNVSYTLFAGGRNRAGHQLAKAAKSEAERNLDAAEIALSAEVQEALAYLRNAREEVVLQRENAELVLRNRDLTEKAYRGGVGSLVRLNEAQRDLVQAQGRQALAQVSLLSTWFRVKTATAESIAPYAEED